MMKKFSFKKSGIVVALSSLFVLGSLSGCTQADKTGDKASTDKPNATSSTTVTSTTQTTTAEKVTNPLTVYASTNVWAAVASAIGGDKIQVVTAISQPSQDPHTYQASANDKLAMNNAKIVLVNGGGYDAWAGNLANTLPTHPMVIDAVNVSQLANSPTANNTSQKDTVQKDTTQKDSKDNKAPAEINEHVFYSLDAVQKVATAISMQLTALDSGNAPIYAQNLAKFQSELDRLRAKAKKVGENRKLTAIYTEPVTAYLLASMGIKDITPADFVKQAETDAGVSAKVLSDTKNLLTSHQASLLVLNAQTEDATAKMLQDTATANHIPVVTVYETLPSGVTGYVDFIDKTLDSFSQAISTIPSQNAGQTTASPVKSANK